MLLIKKVFLYTVFSLFIAASFVSSSFGQVNKPVKPKELKVVLHGNNKGLKCDVTLEFSSGKMEKGYIILPFKSVTLKYGKEGTVVEKKTPVESLKELHFKHWNMKRKMRKGTVFFHSHVTVVLADGSIINDHTPLKGFQKITFFHNNLKRFVYTYFYDYWENEKWLNSGSKDINFPIKNPHKNTVIRIRFYQKKAPMNKFLELLMK